MSDIPFAGVAAPAQPQTVVNDLPCRKCSYNLRGLSDQGRCPECGTPVGLSLSADLLRFSDPTWVETLRTGVRLQLWSIVVLIFAMVAAVVFRKMPQATIPFSFVGSCMLWAGAWLLTAPDPSGIGEDKYGAARKTIRVCIGISIFSALTGYGSRLSAPPPTVRQVLQILRALAEVGSLVGMIANLRYLRALADRIPNPQMSRRAAHLSVAMPICYGTIIVLTLIAVLSGSISRKTPGIYIPLSCAVLIAGLGLLVYGFIYLFLLDKFRLRLREQADLSRQAWAVHAPA